MYIEYLFKYPQLHLVDSIDKLLNMVHDSILIDL
jgi:hypothetical protein